MDLTAGPGPCFAAAFLTRNIWFGSNTSSDSDLENGLPYYIQQISDKHWEALEDLKV